MAVFEKKNRKLALFYSVGFIIIALFVYSGHILEGRTLIAQGDGWDQHYKFFVYFGSYLRDIVKTVITQKRVIIPEFDFVVGEGSDLLRSFHFYGMTEPLSFLSILIPSQYAHIAFSFLMLARMYLAGLVFIWLCLETGKHHPTAIISAALAYSFCNWAVYNSQRHPMYLVPMICFPLLIIGVERIFSGKSVIFLSFAVFLSAISNFFFFFIEAFLLAAYTFLRLYFLDRKISRRNIILFCKISGASLLGMILGGIVILPLINIFLGDARFNSGIGFYLLYPLDYYRLLPSLFITNKDENAYWVCIGTISTCFSAIALLFVDKRKQNFLKALFFLGLLFLIFPFFGQVLNGFSYRSNKWSWALSLLFSYVLVNEWDELVCLSRKRFLLVFGFVFSAFSIVLSPEKNLRLFFSAALLLVSVGILVFVGTGQKKREFALVVLTGLGILNASYWLFSEGGIGYRSAAIPSKGIFSLLMEENEAPAVRRIKKDQNASDLDRYGASKITRNEGWVSGIPSTSSYFTNSNPYMMSFRKDVGIADEFHIINGYRDFASLNTLASVRYWAIHRQDPAKTPFGFEDNGILYNTDYRVLTNSYALPLGYVYDSRSSKSAWEKMTPADRQQSMLSAALIEKPVDSVPLSDDFAPAPRIPFHLELVTENVRIEQNQIITTKAEQKVRIVPDEMVNDSEIAIQLLGFEYYQGTKEMPTDNILEKIRGQLYLKEPYQGVVVSFQSDDGNAVLDYHTRHFDYYLNAHDFLLSLGYSERFSSPIIMTLPFIGTYQMDTFELIAFPDTVYKTAIQKLGEKTLEDVQMGVDTFSGKIKLDRASVLCVTIPYEKGWKATANNEELPVQVVNGHYLGLVLEPGEYELDFKYERPYKKIGTILSCVGILITAGIFIFEKRKKV